MLNNNLLQYIDQGKDEVGNAVLFGSQVVMSSEKEVEGRNKSMEEPLYSGTTTSRIVVD